MIASSTKIVSYLNRPIRCERISSCSASPSGRVYGYGGPSTRLVNLRDRGHHFRATQVRMRDAGETVSLAAHDRAIKPDHARGAK
jgi:hypothetical protein